MRCKIFMTYALVEQVTKNVVEKRRRRIRSLMYLLSSKMASRKNASYYVVGNAVCIIPQSSQSCKNTSSLIKRRSMSEACDL